MTAALNEVEALISKMSAGEKAQVLKWIARDLSWLIPASSSNGKDPLQNVWGSPRGGNRSMTM